MTFVLKTTLDGSKTIFSDRFQECYHSINGAVTESMHVFIKAGFNQCVKEQINIFEVGFGTGLNAYLTYIEAAKHNKTVRYHSIELYPVEDTMIKLMDYPHFLKADVAVFCTLHASPWNEFVKLSGNFFLKKINENLLETGLNEYYDLVYFDAFSPAQQPELWTEDVFRKLYEQMNAGGLLTTYCAKGIVRRTLNKVGFLTERLPGPPGKHEMLRARKE